MRILRLHSWYSTGDLSGENRSVEDECEVLTAGGHEIVSWTPDSVIEDLRDQMRAGFSAIWCRGAASMVRALILERRPDIVHCDNLFPHLSPSVIRTARSSGVPVVMGLRSYRLMCLASNLQRGGSTCDLCVGKVPWRGVVHRCYRDSLPGSTALALSLEGHRRLGTFDQVAVFLASSEYVRCRHIEGGLPADRIQVKPNFSWPAARREGPGEYFLFLGRLVPEKGVANLLDLWRMVGGRLLIAGDGPELQRLQRQAPDGIEFLGPVSRGDIPALIQGAKAVVIPSTWPEPFGRVAIEAYAAGVPVLASRVGGLADIVVDGSSGILVPPTDIAAWALGVQRLSDDGESIRLGEGAWQLWRERFSPRRGLTALENAYRHALELANGH